VKIEEEREDQIADALLIDNLDPDDEDAYEQIMKLGLYGKDDKGLDPEQQKINLKQNIEDVVVKEDIFMEMN